MGQLVQHGYSLAWCGASHNNPEDVLIVYTTRTLNYLLSCMLLPQERWNVEEMQSGVMVVRGNSIPAHLLHLSRGKVGWGFWSQLCTEARVSFNDMANTTDFRTYIEWHSVKNFYLFILLHDWVKINMPTAKFQVEAHYTTVINPLYTLKKKYILKKIWLALLLRILKSINYSRYLAACLHPQSSFLEVKI